MKYEVIARRYRPRQFEEVVGQESVAQTLRGGILQDRLAHAYLFAGPRGIGKTSMARIFAKALNCPRAADRSGDRESWARPCDECATCKAIHLGQDIDVVELDGASHRGIDEIRAIIEGVNRPAIRSPYKIYLIDEVHMLTREAFNALLKTLEEPPGHVKFVFATTEPHKIPETVLSRCQRFDFHPIGEEAIVRRLSQICEAEGCEAEEGLLENVARYGKGGLRDAQTLLDQLMTFAEGPLRQEDLDRITGRVPEASIRRLVETMLARQSAQLLPEVRECFARGADPAVLLEQILETIHARLYELVTAPAAPASGTKPEGKSEELDRVIGSLQILLETATRLRISAYPEVAVEVALLKLSRLEDPRAIDRALERLMEIEDRGGIPPAGGGSPRGPASRAPSPGAPSEAEPAPRAPAGASGQPGRSSDFQQLRSLWEQVLIELNARHRDLASYLKDARLVEAGRGGTGGGEAEAFVLTFGNQFSYRQMKTPRRRETLEDLVREVTGSPWRARMELRTTETSETSEPSTAPAASEPGPQPGPEPGADSQSGPAGQGISQHPLVKKSIELFNGKLI